MAYNTDEEHLESPTNNQSGNPPDEITPTKETETIKSIQETENMEVHHHAHDPAMPHHKKNWKSYFWEFLMLFLAVTLGFFVENQREHYIEHTRASQYASTMLEDLKADNEALLEGIKTNQLIKAKIEKLLSLYDPKNKQTQSTGQLYYYGRYGFKFWHYINKQVTLEQMISSGTIRYFHNSFLENKFVALDKRISYIQYWENREAIFREQSLQYASSLFNYAVLNSIAMDSAMLEVEERSDNTDYQFRQFSKDFLQTNPSLTNDKLVNEFLNFCNLRLVVLDK